jgi:hypothetical protein
MAVTSFPLAMLLSTLSLSSLAQPVISREYQVKATFLFHFTQFVDWPPTSFENEKSPFIIAVAGNDPFGKILDETVAGEKVKGHPIVVQRVKSLRDLEACQLLFVSTEDNSLVKEIIGSIPLKVLTVSDNQDFNNLGGMIRLMKKDNKIKLVINSLAIKSAELEISSKLLNVAEIFVAYRNQP